MPAELRPLSDAELDVLKNLWEEGDGTVRDILARFNSRGVGWAYTTVLTLLQRLEDKGYVSSRRRGRASLFRPAVDRDRYLRLQLGGLAERVCEGSAAPLMLALVEGERCTEAEIGEFRRLLERLAGRRKAKPEPSEEGPC